jgi:hypothetical protein
LELYSIKGRIGPLKASRFTVLAFPNNVRSLDFRLFPLRPIIILWESFSKAEAENQCRRARIPKAGLISLSEKPNFKEEELGPEGMKFQEKFSEVYKRILVSSRN